MDNIRPTWAEIDLAVIQRNFTQIKSKAGKARVMAVVKADAYGHGMRAVAEVCAQNGVDFFGVATVEEALELEEYGYNIPILVLGHVPVTCARDIVQYGIRATVFNEELAQAVAREAGRQGLPGYIHIKMDTGMGRLGFSPEPKALKVLAGSMDCPVLYWREFILILQQLMRLIRNTPIGSLISLTIG